MKNVKQLTSLPPFFLASLGTTIVLAVFAFSIIKLIQYWSIAVECTSCLDSFFANFTSSTNLWFLALFLWSTVALIRAIRFFLQEYSFHQAAKTCGRKNNSVHLLDDVPMAAWSSGFFEQEICVNTEFWNQLSQKEQQALIAHESYHIQERHTLSFLLLGWTKAIIPIPYIGKLIDRLHHQERLRCEYEADNYAIKQTSRTILASLLYKALSFESNSHSFAAARIDSLILERVKHVTLAQAEKGVEKQSHKQTLFVLALFGASFLFVSLSAEMITSCLG